MPLHSTANLTRQMFCDTEHLVRTCLKKGGNFLKILLRP